MLAWAGQDWRIQLLVHRSLIALAVLEHLQPPPLMALAVERILALAVVVLVLKQLLPLAQAVLAS